MPKATIPDPLTRRLLIERDLAPELAMTTAEAYLAEGRTWDAIVFLAKVGAKERIAALREDAIAAGDAFLVRELTRALRDELPSARWLEVVAAAEASGKLRYAEQARRLSERTESQA